MNTSSFHLIPAKGSSLATRGTDATGARGASRFAALLPGLPRLFIGLAVGLGLSLGACNNSGGLLDEPGAALLPGVKINLPPPPSFAEPNILREYPDGSVSIYGLRKEFHRYSDKPNKYLGQKVKVKAYLLDIYKCPECPKKQTCKPCEAPHMFVVDEAGAPKEKGLLVAEYRGFKGKEPKLTLGKQYVYEGSFQPARPASRPATACSYSTRWSTTPTRTLSGPPRRWSGPPRRSRRRTRRR